MRLLTGHLRNFRSAEQLDVDFSESGLHGVVGPPGSGKSTVFAGLVFSMYGTAGPDQSLGDLRYDRAPDDAPVVADYVWTHGGHTYRTRRELQRTIRKGKTVEQASAWMWLDGNPIDRMTPSALTAEVTEILGMAERAYTGSCMIRQGEVDTLTTAAPGEVQKLVEEHTGISRLTKTRDAARKAANSAQDAADALVGSLEEVARTKSDLTAATLEHTTTRDHRDKTRASAALALQEWRAADQTSNELRKQSSSAAAARDAVISSDALHAAAEDRLLLAQSEAKTVGAEVDGEVGEELVAAATKRGAVADAVSAVRADNRNLQAATSDGHAATDAAATLSAATPNVEAEVAALRSQRAAMVQRGQAAREQCATAAAEGRRLDTALTTLAEEHAECPTCRQALADAAGVIAETTRLRDEAATLVEQLTGECDRLLAGVAQIDKDTSARLGSMDQIAKAEAHAEQMEALTRRAQNGVDQSLVAVSRLVGTDLGDVATAEVHANEVLAELDSRIGVLTDLRAAQRAVDAAERDVATAAAARTTARQRTVSAPDSEQVDAAIAAAQALRTVSDDAAAEAASALAVFHAAATGLAQLENLADIAQDQWDRKQAAVRKAEVLAAAADLLHAYRQDLIADFTEGISVAATDLLGRFGGEHVGFQLGPDFVPRVELADGRLRKTAVLSGGEKARAGLAFRLGISMQITDGQMPSQIIGDEVTQYLDDAGRRQVVGTISELFDSPILVSHTDEILDVAAVIHRLERMPMGETSTVAAIAA